MKPRSIGPPDIYFETKMKKMNIQSRYVKESVEKVEKYLAELADARWQKKAENILIEDYLPDMDDTPAL